MDVMNGYKTYVGFMGYGLLGLLMCLVPEMADESLMVAVKDYFMLPLAGVGVAHKLAKM